jgi:hypothetical protein
VRFENKQNDNFFFKKRTTYYDAGVVVVPKLAPGANPTIVSYAVKIYNATSSLVRYEIYFLYIKKNRST